MRNFPTDVELQVARNTLSLHEGEVPSLREVLGVLEGLIEHREVLLEACLSMMATCGGSENWQGATQISLKLMEDAVGDFYDSHAH